MPLGWIPDQVSPEAASRGMGTRIKFRESGSSNAVVCLCDDKPVYKCGEYRGTATWARDKYNLSEDDLYSLSRDYKDSVEREEYV